MARRSELNDQDFLIVYRGSQETAADTKVLEVRRRIARELTLPFTKIKPEDKLVYLRDHYCLVVTGHLALGDLFDDLESQVKATATGILDTYPQTVREYIDCFLGHHQDARRAD